MISVRTQTLVIRLSAQRKSKRAVCVARQNMRAGFSTASAEVGQTHKARRTGRLKSVQPERCAEWLAAHPAAPTSVTFRDVPDAGFFGNCLCLAVPKAIFANNFSCSCKINITRRA